MNETYWLITTLSQPGLTVKTMTVEGSFVDSIEKDVVLIGAWPISKDEFDRFNIANDKW